MTDPIQATAERWCRTMLDIFQGCRDCLGCGSADCIFGPPRHPAGDPCTCCADLSRGDVSKLRVVAGNFREAREHIESALRAAREMWVAAP